MLFKMFPIDLGGALPRGQRVMQFYYIGEYMVRSRSAAVLQ